MAKKLRAGKGFTLTETLITILILSLVTAAGVVAVTTVLSVRNRMIQVANAQTLASIAAEAVGDELRFGQDLTVGDTSVTMNSALFGTGSTLRCTTDTDTDFEPGQLAVEREENSTPVLRAVLGPKTYDDLHFSELGFKLAEARPGKDAAVTVTLTVADSAGHALWRIEFTVTPLNGAAKATP